MQEDRSDQHTRRKLAQETASAYLALNDVLRLSILPTWISADLTLSQAKTIFLLTYYGAQTVSELADKVGIRRPAASTLVQGLVEQGLAQREEDARDRRRTLVALTPQGEKLIGGPQEQRLRLLVECMQELEEDELSGLLHGLRGLAQAVGRRRAGLEKPHALQGRQKPAVRDEGAKR